MASIPYRYTVNENREIFIERYGGDDPVVDIPGSIEGLPVTRIKQYAFAAADVTEIIVPEGVEAVEAEAFAICDSLKRVVLPASLKELGSGVFKGSTELREIVFPKGNARFVMDKGVMYDMTELALVLCPPGLKTEVFTVPLGIKVISAGAFYQNGLLKYVRLPLTIEKIESGAFLFTNSLRMIELPPSVKEIEPDSFLVGQGGFEEKRFEIYAFPDTNGYRYAVNNRIVVHPLYAFVRD